MASLTSQLIVTLVDRVTDPARRIASAIRDLPNAIDRAGERNRARMGELRGQMIDAAGVAYGLQRALSAPIDAAAKFEAAMNRVGAALPASDDEMAALAQAAKDMGATTSFSAIQAANAIETLAKNGLSASQILGGALEASLSLAAATGTDLANAGDIATDVMLQFGKGADELSGVVDGIAGVLLQSKFGIDDYRLALAQAGGVAGGLGIEFSDFNAAIAATSSMFASGSDAGTSFKTFLTTLVPKSAAAEGAMKDLGLEFFNADGSMKSMAEIAQELQDGLAGLSDEAKTDALHEIFGSDAMRTAIGLAEAGGEGIERLEAAIAQASAADEAAARMEGFSGELLKFQSAVEGLNIAIGTALLPALTSILQAFSKMVNPVARLAEAYPQLTTTITAGVAGLVAFRLASVGAAFGGRFLYGTLLSIAAPAARAGLAILGLLNPLRLVRNAINLLKIALIGTGIGAILVGIGLAGAFIYQNWEGIGAAFDAFKTAFDAAVGPARSTLKPVVQAMQDLWSWVETITGPLPIESWQEFGTALGTTAGEMVATLADAGAEVASFIDAFRADPSAAMQGLTSSIDHMVMEARLRLFDLKQAFTSIDWKAAAASIGTGIGAAFGNAGAVLGQLYDRLAAAVDSIDWSVVGASVARGIIDLGIATFNFAKSAFRFMADLLASFKTEAGTTDWSAVGTAIVNGILALGNAGLDFVTGFFDEVKAAIGTVDWAEAGTTIGQSILDGIKTIGADIYAEAEAQIGDAWARVEGYVSGLALDFTQMKDRILAALADLGTRLYEAGVDAAASLWEGFVAMIDGFIGWVSGIPGRIISAIGSIDLGGLIQWPEPPQWWQDIFGEGEADQPSAPTPLSEDQMRTTATARAEAAREAVGGPGFFAGAEARAANEQERQAAFDAAFAEAMAEMRASNEAVVTELRATAEAVSQPGATAPPQAAAAVPGAIYSGEELSPAVDTSAIDAARQRALEARETMEGLETTVRPDVDASAVRGLNTELERSVSLLHQLDETSRTVGERVSQRIGAAESAGQRLSSRLRSSYSDVG